MSRLPDVALDLWRFTARHRVAVRVAPDGCRDLVVVVPRIGAPVSFVSALADGTETPAFDAGDHAVGVRLRAGALVDEVALQALLRGGERADDVDLLGAIGAAVRLDGRVCDALECLGEAPPLDLARRRLGVSERGLERLLAVDTGRSPLWWRNLARARRCARGLAGAGVDARDARHGRDARLESLVHLADVHGYADQAHMARDLRRWFGASPTRLRADAAFLEGLAAPAYA